MPFAVQPQNFTIAPSAARTATATFGPFFVPSGYRGVRLFVDVTAVTSTPSVVLSIKLKDPVGGDYSATILDSAALTAAITAPIVMTVYPGVTAAANVAISNHIGRQFAVTATHADADSITFSVTGEWLP